MQLLAGIILLALSMLPGRPQPAQLVDANLGLPPVESKAAPELTARYRPVALPVRTGTQQLALGAVASLAVDLETGAILHQQNAEAKLPIASIAKLATVMVILAHHQPDEVVTVPGLPAYGPTDAKLGLTAGQRFTIRDLVKAALIPSANDAADALAIIDSGDETAFGKKLSGLLQHWGIDQAELSRPSGLIENGNLVSARALAKLAKIALTNELIRECAATKSTVISDAEGREFALASTNQLLGSGQWSGLKTGYTPAAGQSFLGLVTIKQHPVVTVVLNSPDRFGESARLGAWVEQSYQWQ